MIKCQSSKANISVTKDMKKVQLNVKAFFKKQTIEILTQNLLQKQGVPIKKNLDLESAVTKIPG